MTDQTDGQRNDRGAIDTGKSRPAIGAIHGEADRPTIPGTGSRIGSDRASTTPLSQSEPEVSAAVVTGADIDPDPPLDDEDGITTPSDVTPGFDVAVAGTRSDPADADNVTIPDGSGPRHTTPGRKLSDLADGNDEPDPLPAISRRQRATAEIPNPEAEQDDEAAREAEGRSIGENPSDFGLADDGTTTADTESGTRPAESRPTGAEDDPAPHDDDVTPADQLRAAAEALTSRTGPPTMLPGDNLTGTSSPFHPSTSGGGSILGHKAGDIAGGGTEASATGTGEIADAATTIAETVREAAGEVSAGVAGAVRSVRETVSGSGGEGSGESSTAGASAVGSVGTAARTAADQVRSALPGDAGGRAASTGASGPPIGRIIAGALVVGTVSGFNRWAVRQLGGADLVWLGPSRIQPVVLGSGLAALAASLFLGTGTAPESPSRSDNR